MRKLYAILAILLLLSTSLIAQKNIIFILTDDQGFNQLGCFGSSYYETPNLDSLASKGMKFNQGYAASPVCSPTRSSIMSGKYPARTRVTDWLNGYAPKSSQLLEIPAWKMYLDGREVTIAEKLKENGYKTGFWGKWHIGGGDALAENQGFDDAIEYHNPKMSDFDSDCLIGDAFKDECWDDAHSTIRIAQRAIEFMDENKYGPMYMYISYNGVHTPIIERDSLIQKYKNKEGANLPQNNPTLAAMTQTVDESVGMIYNKVEELGLLDSTIFIYFADNGCRVADAPVSPLRGGKTQLFEGGIREPMIVSWQNTIPSGTESEDYIISNDFYTTILDLVDIPYEEQNYPDSKSFIKSLRQESVEATRPIFWHHPHYHPENYEGPQGAIRLGDYKLIVYYEPYFTNGNDPYDLFNISTDPNETIDLSVSMPEKVAELEEIFVQWKEDIDAQDPTVKGELDIPNGSYYIQAVHSQKVLAAASDQQSANVVQTSLTEDKTQQWQITQQSNYFFTFANKQSKYLMSVDGWAQVPEANVSVWGTTANAGQSCRQWKLVKATDSTYHIIGRHAGMYLEINDSSINEGANLQINDFQKGDKHTEFRLIPIEEEEKLPDGTYYIEAAHSGKVMAVEGASAEQNVNVVQEDKIGTQSQQWILRLQDNGAYTMDNALSEYLLCVAAWGTTPGSNVVVWGTEAAHAQQTCRQWELQKTDDGYYHIQGVHSGLHLQVQDGSLTENANIDVGTFNAYAEYMKFRVIDTISTVIKENFGYEKSIQLTPNPANLYTTLQCSAQSGQYTLYNLKGQAVRQSSFSSADSKRIELSGLNSGIYLFIVECGRESQQIKLTISK